MNIAIMTAKFLVNLPECVVYDLHLSIVSGLNFCNYIKQTNMIHYTFSESSILTYVCSITERHLFWTIRLKTLWLCLEPEQLVIIILLWVLRLWRNYPWWLCDHSPEIREDSVQIVPRLEIVNTGHNTTQHQCDKIVCRSCSYQQSFNIILILTIHKFYRCI